jgi:hypothetical protein
MALQQRTCLYVGAHPGKGCSFWDEIRRAGCRMTVIEVYEPNVKALECMLMNGEEILCADIRDWIPPEKYDLVLWWHGPEHVMPDEAEMVIEKLWSVTRQWLVCGSPWGRVEQGEEYGNAAEKHLWSVDPRFFQILGMQTRTFPPKDKLGGQVVAWRKR